MFPFVVVRAVLVSKCSTGKTFSSVHVKFAVGRNMLSFPPGRNRVLTYFKLADSIAVSRNLSSTAW